MRFTVIPTGHINKKCGCHYNVFAQIPRTARLHCGAIDVDTADTKWDSLVLGRHVLHRSTCVFSNTITVRKKAQIIDITQIKRSERASRTYAF